MGYVAELAVSRGSCHCLLFTGFSCNLLSSCGREQDERVLWAWGVPELHCLSAAPGWVGAYKLPVRMPQCWQDRFTSWLPLFNFCSSGIPVRMSSAQTCSCVKSFCFCWLGEAPILKIASSCNTYRPQHQHLWTFCCISWADWLSNLSLKTSFLPLLELFPALFTAFQLSFWSENPRHRCVFPAANDEWAVLPLGTPCTSTSQGPFCSLDFSKRSLRDSTSHQPGPCVVFQWKWNTFALGLAVMDLSQPAATI